MASQCNAVQLVRVYTLAHALSVSTGLWKTSESLNLLQFISGIKSKTCAGLAGERNFSGFPCPPQREMIGN